MRHLMVVAALLAGATVCLPAAEVRGVVRDQSGAGVAGAAVMLRTAQGTLAAGTETRPDGEFRADVPEGQFILSVDAAGFRPAEAVVQVPQPPVVVMLSPAGPLSRVTVTAQRGTAEPLDAAAAVGAVLSRDELQRQPGPTIGNALAAAPGVLVQQTTYGQVSPFLRGLTGYQVLNLVDGVRLNNATFRSGPNQYLALLEPSLAQRLEVVLGPAGAQFGSDALGGTIQVLTPEPRFSTGPGTAWHSELHAFGATADASGGTSALVSAGGRRWALVLGGSARKHNDLRTGGAEDSRNVYRRLFGLNAAQVRQLSGERLQDSGFAQLGAQAKLAWRPTATQSVTAAYQRSDLDQVRAYNQLQGGLGRLQALFEPQQLNFGYLRYEKIAWGWLDSLSGTFSVNAQRDGTLRQGLRLADRVTVDETDVRAYGYTVQAAAHQGQRQAILFGGELYREQIGSVRTERDPFTGAGVRRRPLYPDDSRYRTGALFVQDRISLFRNRLLINAGGRLTRVAYRTRDDVALGVARSRQDFQDVTGNASLVWQLAPAVAVHALVGRGFRAPNANDLGAIGLNDLGYEIPAAEAVPAGALLAVSAAEGATSTGRPLSALRPERLWNYETGVRVQAGRWYARVHLFNAELLDPIVRRTLLFPAGQAPASLAGLPVTPIAPTAAQRAQGVVTVATALDPRAVKAFVNDGHARYYGVDSLWRWRAGRGWSVESAYSFLVGRELNPNRPVRRLPPQAGHAALRYSRSRRWWAELRAEAAGAQERLSGGDLDDERIGASRSRRDIADFFQGARAARYIDSRGVFTPTGETLAQVQQRVLPGVAGDTLRVPLYTRTAGWAVAHVMGGLTLTETLQLTGGIMNLADRNYRLHGSGIDAPGLNVHVGLTWRR